MSQLFEYPSVALKGSNLHIGQHIVALHGRKKTLMLVEALMSPHGVRRESLRREVYAGRASVQGLSARLRESQDGSLSKLISRSRKLLNESLAETPWSEELDWFVYSDREKSWSLVQKKA